MKNKILYFTVMPSPFQLEFIEYLNSNSTIYEFVPVFLSGIKNYRKTWGETNGKYIIINEKNKFMRYKKIISIIKENRPEKIILTQYNSLYTLLIVLFFKIDFYFGPIENMKSRNLFIDRLKKAYFRLIANKAKALFAIGNNAAKDYAEIYKGIILNIPYTFDLSTLLQSEKNNSQEVIFLCSGRLVPFRNPLLAIECFAEVVKQYSNVKLLMSGVGELRRECDELIIHLNIEKKVEWKNDFSDWYDIHKNLYRQADVLLALQVYSTWGLIIQEAMAAGLGIIATRSMEATNELIIDEYNGFLVDLNKQHIVSQMRQYIENRELLKIHSKRSKDIVKVIDIKNVGDRFLRFFENSKY